MDKMSCTANIDVTLRHFLFSMDGLSTIIMFTALLGFVFKDGWMVDKGCGDGMTIMLLSLQRILTNH